MMEAGRELDVNALVATEVMGWHKKFVADASGGHWYWADETGRCWHRCSRWKPLEDIAAAWEVVEKLCNWDDDDNMLILKGQAPDIEKKEWPDGESAQWWEAEINGIGGKFVGEAITAPRAICLVAFKTKGVENADQDS